jgi:hypothetical protein
LGSDFDDRSDTLKAIFENDAATAATSLKIFLIRRSSSPVIILVPVGESGLPPLSARGWRGQNSGQSQSPNPL